MLVRGAASLDETPFRTPSKALKIEDEPVVMALDIASLVTSIFLSNFKSCMPSDNLSPKSDKAFTLASQGCLGLLVRNTDNQNRQSGDIPRLDDVKYNWVCDLVPHSKGFRPFERR